MSSAVVIVGAGPRGLATALRLLTSRRRDHVSVTLVDPQPTGAVWRADLDADLLMNSRARQATVFADSSVAGVEDDPQARDFAEWAADPRLRAALPEDMRRAAEALTPEGFAPRRLFSHYLSWAGEILRERGARFVRDEAVRISRDGPGWRVRLRSGGPLAADAVVVSTGHSTTVVDEETRARSSFAERHGLAYVPPAITSASLLANVPAGEPVLLYGAGLAFFDALALLTLGRGGAFEEVGGELVYRPSGAEPAMYLTSGRGVPYRARSEHASDYRVPPRIRATFEEMRARDDVNFDDEVWPLLVEELQRVHSDAGGGRMDVDNELDPLRHVPPGDEAALRSAMIEDLADDVRSARERGPRTRAWEALAALKDQVRDLVAAGAFDAESIRSLGGWFRSAGAFTAAGPPLVRVRQVLALVRSGLLTPLGARGRIDCDERAGVLAVRTRELPDPRPFRAVIDARLPGDDVTATDHPLVRSLFDDRIVRTALARSRRGGNTDIGGIAVVRTTPQTLAAGTACRALSPEGTPVPGLFVLGLPVQPQEWNIANLPQPGRRDRTFVQAESIAAQIADERRQARAVATTEGALTW